MGVGADATDAKRQRARELASNVSKSRLDPTHSMLHIENFPVYLHNCDCLADYHCIQIYKDFLLALSKLRYRIDKNSFRYLEEGEKRSRMEALLAYFQQEGLVEMNPKSGEIIAKVP